MPGKTILVIDDDTALRSALCDALTSAGFTTLEAENGEEGFALALSKKPDLILLDIQMPKVSGLQILKRLREDAWGKDARILLLTAMDDATHVTHGVELKSDDYIIKGSESLESIVKKVKQHLAGYHD